MAVLLYMTDAIVRIIDTHNIYYSQYTYIPWLCMYARHRLVHSAHGPADRQTMHVCCRDNVDGKCMFCLDGR